MSEHLHVLWGGVEELSEDSDSSSDSSWWTSEDSPRHKSPVNLDGILLKNHSSDAADNSSKLAAPATPIVTEECAFGSEPLHTSEAVWPRVFPRLSEYHQLGQSEQGCISLCGVDLHGCECEDGNGWTIDAQSTDCGDGQTEACGSSDIPSRRASHCMQAPIEFTEHITCGSSDVPSRRASVCMQAPIEFTEPITKKKNACDKTPRTGQGRRQRYKKLISELHKQIQKDNCNFESLAAELPDFVESNPALKAKVLAHISMYMKKKGP